MTGAEVAGTGRARTVVITGIGVVAPAGVGVKAFWDLIMSGRTATRSITHFDASGFRCQIAAECDFDPSDAGLTTDEAGRMDRVTQFVVAATREALVDSGLDLGVLPPHRTGVSVGSACGGLRELDYGYAAASNRGREWLVDPAVLDSRLYRSLEPSWLAAEVAWIANAEGPAVVISDGCSSGVDAVAYGAELIRDGLADVVVAGATDAPLSPITVACFDAIKATTADNDHPAQACRPFDRNRTGTVLGEGAAILILEEHGHARRRHAHIYAEVAGSASRCNGYHMTGLAAPGREMAEAITATLDRARRNPCDVDYINAHGSGTQQNDRHETAAYKRALGDHAYRVPVSGLKSMVGHSPGGIGSIELVACILALEHQVIPPTANYTTPDPECDLDYVPNTAREQRLGTILKVGTGFGGFQSAMLLTKAAEKPAT